MDEDHIIVEACGAAVAVGIAWLGFIYLGPLIVWWMS